MLVSCLCPTYNRFPKHISLLEEAIESFLRQDYPDKELLICNDTPGQVLGCDCPGVRVFNLSERLPTLTDKLHFLLSQAKGQTFCRWDDDDISLPHRLSYSVAKLDGIEWRAASYWYWPLQERFKLHLVHNPGNTHTFGIWTQAALFLIGGYPRNLSGIEDQEFNTRLVRFGRDRLGEKLAAKDIYYIYRWGASPNHLSSQVSEDKINPNQNHYDRIGQQPIVPCQYILKPEWRLPYDLKAKQAAENE